MKPLDYTCELNSGWVYVAYAEERIANHKVANFLEDSSAWRFSKANAD